MVLSDSEGEKSHVNHENLNKHTKASQHLTEQSHNKDKNAKRINTKKSFP